MNRKTDTTIRQRGGGGLVLGIALLAMAWADVAHAAPITGIVVDESGQPVENAQVLLLGTTPYPAPECSVQAETQSGADGRFKFAESASRFLYSLVARHPNYGLAGAGLDPRTSGDVRLTLLKRSSVAGRVLNTAGKPVKNAVVTASVMVQSDSPQTQYGAPMCEGVLRAVSGEDGAFVLHGIPEKSKLVLRAIAPGYAGALAGLPDQQRSPGGFQPTVQAGAKDVELRLEPEAVVKGRVTLEGNNAPAVKVAIAAAVDSNEHKDVYRGPAKAETAPDGTYTLRGLAGGPYRLCVKDPSGKVAAPRKVAVPAGGSLTGQDFTLVKGVRVAGKFVPEKPDDSLSPERLYLWASFEKTPLGPIEIRADGSFDSFLPPGAVTLRASADGRVDPGQIDTQLAAGQDKTDLVFQVKTPLKFKGRVLDVNGKPVAGAEVKNKMGPSSSVKTDAEGRFELPTPSWMGIGERGDTPHFVEASLPGNENLRAVLYKMLRSPADLTGDLVLRPVGVVRGRVVDDEGHPLPNETVTPIISTQSSGAADGSCHTNEEGRFEFLNALVGWDSCVSVQGQEHGQAQSKRFTLEDGETVELEDLVLAKAALTVEGVIQDEQGNPMAGVDVQLNGRGTGSRHAKSDEKGRFRVEHVVDESVDLFVWDNTSTAPLNGQARAMAGDTDLEIVLSEQSNRGPGETPKKKSLVNAEAPALDVAAWASGDAVDLASLRGKGPVVVAFYDAADAASAELMACLKALPARGLAVVAVHRAGADPAALKGRMAQEQVPFSVAIDKPGALPKDLGTTFNAYGVRKPPGVFLIDKEGKVQFQDLPMAAVPECAESLTAGK